MRILARLLGRREGFLVSRQTVVEEGGRPQRKRESHPLAVAQELLGRRRDGSVELVLATAERCDRELPYGGTMRPSVASASAFDSSTSDAAARDVAAEEAHADTSAEGERKLGERAGLAGGSDLAHRQ